MSDDLFDVKETLDLISDLQAEVEEINSIQALFYHIVHTHPYYSNDSKKIESVTDFVRSQCYKERLSASQEIDYYHVRIRDEYEAKGK
tara:strand:+ start:794 stop:1057 length:264 start_codon:yes stop_codon:yes gene_type:complete